MEGKAAVQVQVVFDNDEVKRDQIVMCPNDCLATRHPNTTDEKLPTPQSDISPLEKDGVMNYGLQILQMGFLLLELNDTEKERDGEGSLLNWKILMLYFRSRSRGMKYAFEAMRYITMTKALYTERIAHRIIHGQFVNHKGGAGNNCANDLTMEHMVRNNKIILKGLCGNRTLKAIQRNSSAAYSIQKVIKNFDSETAVSPNSSAHTHANKFEDEKEMIDIVNKNMTFIYQSGRAYKLFPGIRKSPLEKLDVVLLDKWLTHHRNKLFNSPFVHMEEEDDSDDENSLSEEKEYIDFELDDTMLP